MALSGDRWPQEAHSALGYRCARACEARAELLAQACLDIASGVDPAKLTLGDGTRIVVLDPNGATQINRLRIDTRWALPDPEGPQARSPAMRNSPATAP